MDAAQTKVDENVPTLVVAVALGADQGLHEGEDKETREDCPLLYHRLNVVTLYLYSCMLIGGLQF